MRFTTAVVTAALGTVVMAQSALRGPLEGVWRATEIVATGANPSTIPNPQASVYIFTRTHYSVLRVTGAGPRALFETRRPTDEEKLVAYDTFVATSGTYELSGSTLTLRPIVAKTPNLMAGGSETFEVRVEGDTVWLTLRSTDVRWRTGDRIEPASGPVTVTRFRLLRIE
jgi:hypothetical protein